MLHFRFGSACSDSATPAGSEPPPSLRTGRTEEIRFSLKKAFRGRPSVYSIRFLKLSTTPASANCLWFKCQAASILSILSGKDCWIPLIGFSLQFGFTANTIPVPKAQREGLQSCCDEDLSHSLKPERSETIRTFVLIEVIAGGLAEEYKKFSTGVQHINSKKKLLTLNRKLMHQE
ncbi:unnamed protein product [Malus fusca]